MEKLVVIAGTNASGKSGLGIELAEKFNAEIVSADSRQVFEGLDLGSGKVTKEEMKGIRHHLLDVAKPNDFFSLSDYQSLAYSAVDDIVSRGKTPFLVGGTGLYVNSVVDGYNLSTVAPDMELRQSVEAKTLQELIDILHTDLDKRWYGMGMSEHIGFKHWNEEECAKPVPHQVIAANKARLIAAVPGTYMHTEGGDWTKRPLKVYTDDSATINLFSAAYLDTYYDVECKDDFLFTDKMSGVLTSAGMDFITILVDKNVRGDNDIPGKVILHNDYGNVEILVYPKSMEPVKVLKNYSDELLSDYNVDVKEAGEYEIKAYISPANPPYKDNKLLHKVIVNGEENIVNAVSDSFSVGDHQTEWYDGVLNNIRISSFKTKLKTGTNQLRFEPVSVGVFYNKITIAAL